MTSYILAIDQGTTSSRAIMFDKNRRVVAIGQQEFPQHFPNSGWVEHDPEDLWSSTVATCRTAIERAGIDPTRIAAIGITNQRETTVIWDKATGKPAYNAIVWQDRRTAPICARLRDEGHEPGITAKTGLLLDPYFSGTKVAWILDNVAGARARAERGELLFGTVDCYLIWRLTGGAVHATDATNASRTMLYNIHDGAWDADLCALLGVPMALLPGLGAPYWDADCRGSIHGLTRATGPAEIAKAALESVGYQTRDLLEAMKGDWANASDTVLRVDGGMTASDWTMQFLADILGAPVDRPQVAETTALGAAWLAGMQAGVYPAAAEFAESWALERRFEPMMDTATRSAKYAGWKHAVRRTLSS